MSASVMRQTTHIAMVAVVTLMPLTSAHSRDLARIYVYVPMEAAARSWFPISCDSTVVAKLKRGRFFAVNVAPGRHMLSDEKGVPVSVDARSGEESFVRVDWRMEVGGPAISVLQVVPPSAARSEMIYLTYIDASKVHSKSVSKKDPREPPRLLRRGGPNNE